MTSWIDAYATYTDSYSSPPIFKKWSAIAVVAGALERKVWVKTRIANLYPNLYTILVGPPGGGKTLLTSLAKRLWNELPGHHIASDSISRASLLDDLREAERRVIRPDLALSMMSFNSLKIAIDELQVLIPAYEGDFIAILTAIYDGHLFAERKRTKELKYRIDAPQINLLGGCTASFLRELLPEGAWDQGFTARIIFIYSGETFPQELFGTEEYDVKSAKMYDDLANDLKIIGDLAGKMSLRKEVVEAITEWHLTKGKPRPDHPKLAHYNTRRSAHLIKLCMIASTMRRDDLEITLDDYQLAMSWLLEAEAIMPDIFKSMSMGGDSRLIEEAYHFAYQVFVKYKKPIPQSEMLQFLAERAPAHAVNRILEVMVGAKILEERLEPVIGKCYVPKMKKVI